MPVLEGEALQARPGTAAETQRYRDGALAKDVDELTLIYLVPFDG
jgi:hypothetical protein